jgi:hypothetical protein
VTETAFGVALRDKVGVGAGGDGVCDGLLLAWPPHPTNAIPAKKLKQITADRAHVRAYMNFSDKSADCLRAYQEIWGIWGCCKG